MKAPADATPHRPAPTATFVALTVAIVLAAVWASAGSVTFRVATVPAPSNGSQLALATGPLGGQANLDGTACFWLGTGQREAILWPYGFTARGSLLSVAGPLAAPTPAGRLGVYDRSGARVAEIGQIVNLVGGVLSNDVRSITGCAGFARVWRVGAIGSAK
jgi:hypothetical protein